MTMKFQQRLCSFHLCEGSRWQRLPNVPKVRVILERHFKCFESNNNDNLLVNWSENSLFPPSSLKNHSCWISRESNGSCWLIFRSYFSNTLVPTFIDHHHRGRPPEFLWSCDLFSNSIYIGQNSSALSNESVMKLKKFPKIYRIIFFSLCH
jgi:hypothetical protein